MKDQEHAEAESKTRHRSPAWPFIPLEKAVIRAGEFYKAHRDRGAKPSAANVSWGMKPKSGAGSQTIATLRQYGLMDDAAEGIKLTDLALRIVRDTREVSPERDASLQEAALHPSIFAEIRRKWEDELPGDADVKFYLTHERGFSEDAANGLLNNYKATVRYAKLAGSGSASDSGHGGTPSGGIPPKPGVPPAGPTRLMEGERIVFTHEVEPDHGVRIVASGAVDEELIDAVELFLVLNKKRLGLTSKTPKDKAE